MATFRRAGRGVAPTRLFDPAARRLLATHARGRAAPFMFCLIAAGAQSLMAVPMVPLVRIAFDRAIPRGDVGLLLAVGAGIAVVRLASGMAMVCTRGAVVSLKTAIVLEIRRDLLVGLYERPHVSHVRGQNQPFLQHMISDADRIDAMLDQVLANAVPAALTCLLLLGAMIYLNPLLVGVGLVFLPLVAVVGRSTTLRIRANVRRFHKAHDAFVSGVSFVLDNFALTRSRAAEAEEVGRQAETMKSLRGAAAHMVIDSTRAAQVQSFAVALVGVAILLAGGVAVGRHAMTMGGLLAFFVAGGLAAGQIDRLIATLPIVVEGSAALTRLGAYLSAAPPQPYRGRRGLDWSGRINLEAVDFSYGAGKVLRQASLALEPGVSAGIIGPNGAGKTTILSLILGLYRPDSGRLTADGVDYGELDLRALRRGIGLVPQHPQFFSAGVFENITYGAPGVTRREVEALAERLGAGRMLAALPGGLDAPLGQGGLLLSGGQGQMIAILRALAVRPRLLVLDEPTNHLDQATIHGLMAAIAAAMERPSILLISHDPSVAASVQTLYRLDAGRLVSVARAQSLATPG